MKARFTIIVAALLASSLFGDFFQARDNCTPKGETGDLKAKISRLEGQVDDLRRNNRELERPPAARPHLQSTHEADLNRLRARIAQLEQENNALRRELAQRNDVAEEPVNQPATNRVEGFRSFGPPPSAAEMRARFEEMRAKDPEHYAQITNNMAQWRARRQERLQNQFDILASADTTHMTKEQRKVHETYQDLLARQEELHELMNPNNTEVTDAQREAAMKELRDISHQLHDLQRTERDTLLILTANALGLRGKQAQEVVTAIKAVYEATGGGGHRGPPGGPGGRGRR